MLWSIFFNFLSGAEFVRPGQYLEVCVLAVTPFTVWAYPARQRGRRSGVTGCSRHNRFYQFYQYSGKRLPGMFNAIF